jgi:UDP-glucose 4-epimerase
MRILITGGTGFVGSHTVVSLVGAGYQPVIVDDLSNSNKSVLAALQKIINQKIAFYKLNYGDQTKLETILKKESIEGIIHFAAFKSLGESIREPLKYYKNNVANMVGLLETAEKLGLPLIFSSSAAVYGAPQKLPITEEASLPNPTRPYQATKLMGEQMLRDVTNASKHLKSISLRYFNPIGAHSSGLIGENPKNKPDNLVPSVMLAAKSQTSLSVFGGDYPTPDGTCIRDFIHVMDVAEAHVKAFEHLKVQGPGYYDVFNIGTGRGHSVLEVINEFEKVTGQKLTYKIGDRRRGDLPEVYASADKAQRILGWESKLSLADGLSDAWNWPKKHTP